MSETNDTKEEPKQYTPEEIKAMRAKSLKFYKEENVHLKAEAIYYDLKAQIEESKARELRAIIDYAQMMQPTQQQQPQQEQPEMGDDGFPLEWDKAQKADYLKANPEYKKELARWKKAKAEAKKEEAAEKKPAEKETSKDKPKREPADKD